MPKRQQCGEIKCEYEADLPFVHAVMRRAEMVSAGSSCDPVVQRDAQGVRSYERVTGFDERGARSPKLTPRTIALGAKPASVVGMSMSVLMLLAPVERVKAEAPASVNPHTVAGDLTAHNP